MMNDGVLTRSKDFRSFRLCNVDWHLSTIIYPNISTPCSYYIVPSYLYAVIAMDPYKSIPDFYHQCMGADDPCILLVFTHILYISLTTMYSGIAFCHWVIYPSTIHRPASFSSYPMVRYTQLTYGFLLGLLYVSHQANWLWKIPSARMRRGYMIHFSNLNIKTDSTTV